MQIQATMLLLEIVIISEVFVLEIAIIIITTNV